ncbi:hypothetical protein ACHIPZ_26000 [Antrihabitans sp. NCIMB 15449]|uniref:DUF4235 domain-containing protein n=1 Tax=Antrihabitans spumae TaxID=3373370 RepID=A0ABW7JVN6_9NOCA
MTTRNTLVRSMHDVGAAAWFGGSLMGATGLNGAASDVKDPNDRARIAADGWARWAPISAVAIGMHGIGGLGLIAANRKRVAHQDGVAANTTVKTVVTLAAAGATAYSGYLGSKVAREGRIPAAGATEPAPGTPEGAQSAQKQLRVIQWVIPVLTGAVVVLAAQQGEQQRGGQIVSGLGRTLANRLGN